MVAGRRTNFVNMVITPCKQRTILPSLNIARDSAWRAQLERLEQLGIASAAMIFRGAASDERREAYRLLERSTVTSVPYVGLQAGMESWELDFLVTKRSTEWFSAVASDSAYAFLTSVQQYADKFLIENPIRHSDAGAFSEPALDRSGAAGICLNLATLERKRVSDRSRYDSMLFVLDHHPIKVTKVSSVPIRWYRRLFQNQNRPGKLSSLTELSYLKHVPTSLLANMVVMEFDNTIDEQLEAGRYFSFVTRR